MDKRSLSQTTFMDKQYLYLIIGVLAGVLVGVFSARYTASSKNYGMMKEDKNEAKMVSSKEGHGMDMSMNEMSQMLEDIKGDEFDEMFLDMMISHHQGAIDMANLALTNSERKEIKDLAEDIISAQTTEIKMMEGWIESWW